MAEDECLEALKELGEAAYNQFMTASTLRRDALILWGEEVPPSEFVARFWSELTAGRLRLKDREVCAPGGGCLLADRVLSDVRRYTRWSGMVRRLLRRAIEACRG